MGIVARVLAGAVGVVIAWAGAGKVTDRRDWNDAASAQGVPAVVSTVLPWVELVTGVCLVALPVNAVVLGIATLLLVVFTAWLVVQVAGRSTVPCNCFGSRSVRPPSLRDVLRNVVLIAALFAAAVLS